MSQAGRGGVIRRGYPGGHATDFADADCALRIPEPAAEGRLRGRIWVPLRSLLSAGLAPKVLAWSVAAGLAFGIIPLLGTSTALCAGAAFAFRLNQPAMQLANYAAYPVQLALLLPFIRLGERLFGTPPLPLSLAGLEAVLRADAWGALGTFWTSFWHAGVAWLLVVPLPAVLLARLLVPVFQSIRRSFPRT